VRVPFSLGFDGAGAVTGATIGQMIELRRGFKLVARTVAGYLFAAWTGDVQQDNPTLQFLMDSNTTVTAVFGTNLFPYVKGTYNGLFYNGDVVEQQSSGYLTLRLGSLGSYSARISMNGRNHRFSGTFFVDGSETNLVARAGTNFLLLRLTLDLTNGRDQITGTITNNQVSLVDPAHGWSALVIADRATFDGRTLIATQSGRYTMLVPHGVGSSSGPDGDGFAGVKVSARGMIALAGTLADGTKAAQKTTVSKNGTWPLYVSLYKDKGALLSWVTFTNDTFSDFSGLANWFKQTQPRTKYYRAGFTNETTLLGSRYTPPSATNRVLNFTDGLIAFTDGNLAENFANQVLLIPNGKVVNLGTNKLSVSLSKPSGLFRGTVIPPGATRSLTFRGAVIQKQNRGGGFIMGTNETGQVTFDPDSAETLR
jgi:hypothetical protein